MYRLGGSLLGQKRNSRGFPKIWKSNEFQRFFLIFLAPFSPRAADRRRDIYPGLSLGESSQGTDYSLRTFSRPKAVIFLQPSDLQPSD